jgi:hypothetical protein
MACSCTRHWQLKSKRSFLCSTCEVLNSPRADILIGAVVRRQFAASSTGLSSLETDYDPVATARKVCPLDQATVLTQVNRSS